MRRADHLATIDRYLRDDTGLIDAAAREAALDMAIDRLSVDRPRLRVQRLGYRAGGVALTDLPGWTDGLSQVRAVEYPTLPESPRDLPSSVWMIGQIDDGPALIIGQAVSDDEAIGIRYTAPHVLDDPIDTIPPACREPVAAYAAAHLFEGLAAAHAGDRDPVLDTEAAGLGDIARAYAARAARMREIYQDGLAAGGAAAMSVAVAVPAPGQRFSLFRRG